MIKHERIEHKMAPTMINNNECLIISKNQEQIVPYIWAKPCLEVPNSKLTWTKKNIRSN